MREKPTEPGQPSGECESIYFALSGSTPPRSGYLTILFCFND
jgi:hypothetical protein